MLGVLDRGLSRRRIPGVDVLLIECEATVAALEEIAQPDAQGKFVAGLDAEDLSGRVPVEGASEIRQLAMAFNRVLDRLEDAFDRQRQFASDASHELRTPLTAIRGQIEVLARSHSPTAEEIDETAGRVTREVARLETARGELSTAQDRLARLEYAHSMAAALADWRDGDVRSTLNRLIAARDTPWDSSCWTSAKRSRVRIDSPDSATGTSTGSAGGADGSIGASLRLWRCSATHLSTARHRFRHRCQRSLTCTASGAPAAAPPAYAVLPSRQMISTPG